ncbi:MAG: 3-deoxy-8-phosphooctulonate synthase [Bacteroidales bacterium]|nr:3-deoxy-8-phosphooctulonate synthase [Bacteroidales bacterium]
MSDFIKNFNKNNSFFLIAGPCVVESEELCIEVAETLSSICSDLEIPWIFKASYRKANRSKINSFTGIGDKKALEILARIGEKYNVPVITDIHESSEASLAAAYVDILQIPAFLCRQTDLLLAAGRTGKPVNIKKAQFLAPEQMAFAIEKITSTGNTDIMLTERGSIFGYRDLIVDFRSIPEMKKTGYPVIFDGTHSLQKPNSSSGITGGLPEHIQTMCKAAIAVGTDGLFLETHPKPSEALSDGANMISLDQMKPLLSKLKLIHSVL